MKNLVIVSMHEKGFPQADIYLGCGEMPTDEFNRLGIAPDGFFTMKAGETLEDAKAKADVVWPGSVIVEGEEDEPEDEEDE